MTNPIQLYKKKDEIFIQDLDDVFEVQTFFTQAHMLMVDDSYKTITMPNDEFDYNMKIKAITVLFENRAKFLIYNMIDRLKYDIVCATGLNNIISPYITIQEIDKNFRFLYDMNYYLTLNNDGHLLDIWTAILSSNVEGMYSYRPAAGDVTISDINRATNILFKYIPAFIDLTIRLSDESKSIYMQAIPQMKSVGTKHTDTIAYPDKGCLI
ncbi:MAG: hypothetical protein ACRCXT_13130 [Paraclostridium sp.]